MRKPELRKSKGQFKVVELIDSETVNKLEELNLELRQQEKDEEP